MNATKIKKYLCCFLTVLLMTGCSSVATMTSSNMDKLELGMTKEQVTSILGKGYKIAEKRMDGGLQVEVLSYRDFNNKDEFYLFQFKADKLEKWYRELSPKYEIPKK